MLTQPDARRFWIATAEDIVLHKLHWFRAGGELSDRQWRDILGVLRMQRGLDLGFLRAWADRMLIRDLLERAFADADG